MIRWLTLAGLLLAASCAPVQPPTEPPQVVHGPLRPMPALGFAIPRAPKKATTAKPAPGDEQASAAKSLAASCRVGPDGGPIVADRGIGGTGVTAGPSRVADRGIGGTGIVGVVTGFASVCVDDLEVGLDRTIPVDMDVATEGAAGSGAGLRVGQIVVISAMPQAAGLRASRIAVRHEVAGPIEAVEIGSGAIVVAGQRVTVPSTAWSVKHLSLGDWVAVSGLRAGDGTIVASRLDPDNGRIILVRGRVGGDSGSPRIGTLALMLPAGMQVPSGKLVSVTGTYEDGVLRVASLRTDLLMSNPPAFFGNAMDHVVIQSFVRVSGGQAHLGGDVVLPAAPDVAGTDDAGVRAIVSLERQRDGSYVATGVKATDGRTAVPAAISQEDAAGQSQVAALTGTAGPASSSDQPSAPGQGRIGHSVSGITAAPDLPLPPVSAGLAVPSDAGAAAPAASPVAAPASSMPSLATATAAPAAPAPAPAPLAVAPAPAVAAVAAPAPVAPVASVAVPTAIAPPVIVVPAAPAVAPVVAPAAVPAVAPVAPVAPPLISGIVPAGAPSASNPAAPVPGTAFSNHQVVGPVITGGAPTVTTTRPSTTGKH